jgi:phosphatidylglycerophosphatase A
MNQHIEPNHAARPERDRVEPDWRRWHHWLAFGLGSGLAPKAPGTWGTLAAVPLYLLMSPLPIGVYLAVVAALFALGIWVCGETARDLGLDDPSAIVWDEWVGLLVTLALAPDGWGWLLVGFGLFRLFDIVKPWPIRFLDRSVHGGLGIMIDDLVAGLMAWLVLQGAVLVVALA